MDPNSLANYKKNVPRKVKYAPKAPPRRDKKTVIPKVEKVEDDFNPVQDQELLRRFNESTFRLKPKAERKVEPTQVAFGYTGSYSGSPSVDSYKSVYASGGGTKKEYKEPLDYYTYYATTLPQRRPYSGDPEVLNKEEFKKDVKLLPYDEGSKSAVELGLMGENMEESMFLFQLPDRMPIVKEQPNANANRNEQSNSNPSKRVGGTRRSVYKLQELPAGFMGKLLVYKSGAVKLKLGDKLFDVSGGIQNSLSNDAVAINIKENLCCSVGEINHSAIVTPDVDSMLDDMVDM